MGVEDTPSVYFRLRWSRSDFGLARCERSACNSLGPRRRCYWSRLALRPPGFFRINPTKTRSGAARLPQSTSRHLVRGKQIRVESTKRDGEEIHQVSAGKTCLPTLCSIMCVYTIECQCDHTDIYTLRLVICDNEARPPYLQWADLRCVGHVCSFLMFGCCRNLTDVCLLKQGGSRYPPPPTRPGRILENNIARYVIRNQAQRAEDSESTGEHHRIEKHAIFRFFPHFVVFDGFI